MATTTLRRKGEVSRSSLLQYRLGALPNLIDLFIPGSSPSAELGFRLTSAARAKSKWL